MTSTAIVCAALVLSANAYEATFARGVQAYEAGDYAGAAEAFEQLAAEGVAEADVFYNLGNAYYRGGRLGPAIANYERALQLRPGFEASRDNLAQCVNQTERRLARPLPSDLEQSLLFWHYNLPPGATRWLALGFWLALWTLLAVRQWRPLPYLRRAAFVCAVLAAAFGGSAWVKAHGDLYAVASAERVPVHYGTNEAETVRFELYAGDRVLVDRRERGWLRVTTVDGERGWAKEAQFTLVGPPYLRPPDAAGGSVARRDAAS